MGNADIDIGQVLTFTSSCWVFFRAKQRQPTERTSGRVVDKPGNVQESVAGEI